MDPELTKKLVDPRQTLKLGRSLLSGANSRIGNLTAIFMLFVALIFDLCTLIPFVGDAAGPIFWVGMSLYLWHKGCGFIRPSRLVTEIVSVVIEMIPVLQALPAIIAGTLIVIILIRLEDKTGVSVMKPMLKNNRQPLNHAGVRLAQTADDEERTREQRNPNTRPLNIDGMRQPSR